ncbi:MAG: hypothetical protein KF889_02660 [Alphaproteobacteria bacterium]|nr:hypothetical protein [Alphaproteobacteria bacterium]MCW5741811.1 hypothetical protein [Alphaproteobacteria bacterium]
MPLPNFANLQANPALILPWLNDNLLIGGLMQNVAAANGEAWVSIGAAGQAIINGQMKAPIAVNPSGKPIDVFAIRSNGTGVNDSVRAYVCNYTAGGVHSVPLAGAGAANFCFTITLNGCTFGIGPAAADGSRRVSHANQGGQTAGQRNQTWNEHGVPVNSAAIKMFEPALYRRLGGGISLNATVFGFRIGTAWEFHFQLYQAVANGQYKLVGVFPIQS